MGLKEVLKSMNCLEGVIMLRRFYLDPNFRQICCNYYDESARIIYCKKMNSDKRNKLVLRIPVHRDSSGFFCNYFCMLNIILEFEIYGLPFVVDWEKSIYRESEKYRGTDNPFEYYFEPVSGITLAEMQSGYQTVVYNKNVANYPYKKYQDVNELEQLADINRRYIRLNKDVRDQLSLEINSLLGRKKTLAVHVRGVEWGQVKGHPVPASLESYIFYIEEALNKFGFEQIFLATDSEDTVAYLHKRYGEKLVWFSDALRSESGSNTLMIYDRTVQRVHHQYRLGYEVLRDVETMSACQGFVGGLSYVAFAVEVFKISKGQKFEYKGIVHQVIQKNGIKSQKAIGLMEKGRYRVKNAFSQR